MITLVTLNKMNFYDQRVKVEITTYCWKSPWTSVELVCTLWIEEMSFIMGIKHTLISFNITRGLPSLPSHSRPFVMFNYLWDTTVCTLPQHHKTVFVSQQVWACAANEEHEVYLSTSGNTLKEKILSMLYGWLMGSSFITIYFLIYSHLNTLYKLCKWKIIGMIYYWNFFHETEEWQWEIVVI